MENWLLNCAGICAILVAFFPKTNPQCNPKDVEEDVNEVIVIQDTRIVLNNGDIFEKSETRRADCAKFAVPIPGDFSWHGAFASIFSLFGALSIWAAHKTLDDPRVRSSTKASDDHDVIKHRNWYSVFYWCMLTAMALSPLVAWISTLFWGTDNYSVFAMEAGGMLAFAAYWWIKSDEIEKTGADRLTVRANDSQ